MKTIFFQKKQKLVATFFMCFVSIFAIAQIKSNSEPWKISDKVDDLPSNARISAGLSSTGSITYDGTGVGTLGDSSSYFGFEAGKISTGSRSVFIGSRSGYSNTTGRFNTFVGSKSGFLNTTGEQNTYVGFQSGRTNTTGLFNVGLGSNTGYSNTTGKYNTAIGAQAGVLNTSGENNTFLGNGAGYASQTGWYNTLIGESSGTSLTSGQYNTFLGSNSGKSNLTGSKNVFIGYKAGYNELGSNKLYIANSDTISPLIKGDFSSKQLVFNGKVGIATTSFPSAVGGANVSSYQLFVKGGILSEEVRVRNGWADYVFQKGYKLNALEDVKMFIKTNGHLPNVPSAKQVEADGLNLGDISRIQMEKIEELTLYVIKQDELMKAQQKQIDELKNLIVEIDNKK
jgi:hypothetical protein